MAGLRPLGGWAASRVLMCGCRRDRTRSAAAAAAAAAATLARQSRRSLGSEAGAAARAASQNASAEFVGLQTEFPCLLRNPSAGPEPDYQKVVSGYQLFESKKPFKFKYNKGLIPELNIAYETWGQLNAKKDNAVIIHAGLSASSHAKSHEQNAAPGWWEKFVGPGRAVDTDKFFVICTNTLGGCYGSTGPASVNPVTGANYATTFPVLSVSDMVRAQFLLLDHLGIDVLYASVGSSLGGMCSLMSAAMFPDRVGRMVSISSCASSHPTSIAVRYLQRKAIMTDPNWNKGYYYQQKYPRLGMKLAREIATMTYRSGPEWDQRFARKRIGFDDGTAAASPGSQDGSAAAGSSSSSTCQHPPPSLCPTFLIESYLDYQGEMFCTKFDPNSLLYISKAMDLFDVGEDYGGVLAGLSRVTCPVLVLGVQTDILFPVWQQRELAQGLLESGNKRVTYYELNSIYGHDTFLLDLSSVGAAVKGFLETDMQEIGRTRPVQDRASF